ncbi:MAG: hypothetical protein C0582_02520 [Alphaproteobacteria bacterium]|nr:MAG: hypothetical protein C0582_02520 [Alphaproteobacteria bacterium]
MRFYILIACYLTFSLALNAAQGSGDDLQKLSKVWGLEPGIYISTPVNKVRSTQIFFLRLNDDERRSKGGGNQSDLPSAAIYSIYNNKKRLWKKFCRNFCWMTGNQDPIPSITQISDKKYILWAPENPEGSRHGTNGRLELYDVEKETLTPFGPEIYIHYSDSGNPIKDIFTEKDKTYLKIDTLEFIDMKNAPAEYIYWKKPLEIEVP